MSNFITIELCTEDRARVDKLIAALEQRTCDKCVKDAIEYASKVQQKAPEQEAEASPHTTNIPNEETGTQAPPAPAVTHDELMAKVIELSAKDIKLKAQVRDIILSYAPRVKAVPEEKVGECYERLAALEG